MFTWDDEKRKINLAKHGIDFCDAAGIHETRFYFSQIGK